MNISKWINERKVCETNTKLAKRINIKKTQRAKEKKNKHEKDRRKLARTSQKETKIEKFSCINIVYSLK